MASQVSQRLDQPSEDARTQVLVDQILQSLTSKAKIKDDDSHMISAVARSHSPRSNKAGSEDTPNDNTEEPHAAGATLEKATSEETVEYPPPAQAALVMLALLLALFLSALVSQ